MKPIPVLKRFIQKNISLSKEEDEKETYQEIAASCEFSGFNLWILGFAMVIACIGLNTNSNSAVIGAMLISPLMGPIVGYGFSLSINDSSLKNKAIRNWLWMTLTSLTASILFFLLSPFDHNTDVLNSFTQASIFDILIAFFGGMAGFIGIMKRDGVKVMAGVAVATACMPPLCTAGFAVAHGQWLNALGGLYFYLINCLFIGVATFLTSRLTGFHEFFCSEKIKTKMQTSLWILFIVAMFVPATYIVWNKWKQEHDQVKVKTTEQRLQEVEKRLKEVESSLPRNTR